MGSITNPLTDISPNSAYMDDTSKSGELAFFERCSARLAVIHVEHSIEVVRAGI